MNYDLKKYLRYSLYLIIIEAILGGGGREFTIRSLTIRMILFGIAFFIFIICLIQDRKIFYVNLRDMDIKSKLLILFGFWLIFAALYGHFISKNSLSQIAGDLTGYASLALLFLFNYSINNKIEVEFIAKLISVCVVIQAFAIVVIHYALGMGILQFNSFNATLQRLYIGNLAFIAPDSIRIFFKSSIYLQVGFIILLGMLLRDISKKKKIIIYISLVIVSYAIILSFTRGFWIAVVGTTIIYLIFKKEKKSLKIISIILAGIILMIGLSNLVYRNINIEYSIAGRTGLVAVKQDVVTGKASFTAKGDAGEDLSLAYRVKLKKAMFAHIKRSPIIGDGFGVVLTEIGQTQSRCEYMFYDIWMELGLIGLILYVSVFVILCKQWLDIRKHSSFNEVNFLDEYMIAFLGVIFTSALNPFLNNPLGITYLLILICSINVYKKKLI